ncbi:hypothetical protein [Arthrobacter agilis]|uniref:hypothetical protein n=1 Tax=Arthrobacter agilis TaxID=37921 RepID=UPI0027817717|nr:hypothetical protein [Arthrobacter agilis]MDQ0735506.1 uncharacterized protein with LGFP repeats [Arthrobacter agilis]
MPPAPAPAPAPAPSATAPTVEPAPATVPGTTSTSTPRASEPAPAATDAAAAAPDQVTSFVPDLNWNPLADPNSNARYGEHYTEPVTPMKAASPLRLDGSGGNAAIAPRSGEFKVTLVTVQLAGKTKADADAINMTAARNSILKSNEYWNSATAGRLSMKQVNEYRHVSAAKITDSYGTIMDKVTKELNWQYRPYESLVIFVPHADLNYNGSWGILGGGFTDGPTSGRVIMPYPSALTNNVVTHEFGHVLGLHHANSLACSNGRLDVARSGASWTDPACWSAEYSDTSDLMGYAQTSSPQINAFLWEYGGFGRGDEIQDLGTPAATRSVTLRPWAGTASSRAVKFTESTSGETYYLELRAPVGNDAVTAVGGNRGVKITKQDILGWSGNASIVLTPNSARSGWGNTSLTWQQGQTFTTQAGTRLRIDSVSNTEASVTIEPVQSVTSVAGPLVEGAAARTPAVGDPVSGLVCGISGGGCYQNYQYGQVHWTKATGAHATQGAVNTAWGRTGWEKGVLGYPVSDLTCGLKNSGCVQSFQGGNIYWTPATGATLTLGAIDGAWSALGRERSTLGYPTGNENCGLTNGGCYQNFQGGQIHWSPTTGASATWGPIALAWGQAGWEKGTLGYPTSNETCGLTNGGCYQNFQGGQIHRSATTSPYATTGTIASAWAGSGWEKGKIGYPTSNAICRLVGNGCLQTFQKGNIYTSPATGTAVTSGAIDTTWSALGRERGKLGYPTANETCGLTNGGCYQNFQGGQIHWSPTTGAQPTYGTIASAWAGSGWENGTLGYPTSGENCGLTNSGCYQNFQKGQIHWSPTTGAYATRGVFNTAWGNTAWEAGTLGYPTSNQSCGLANSGCYQNFQGGQIHWSPTTGAHPTTGAIGAAWRATGWENGTLGYPTTDETCTTTKTCTQKFQKGQLSWSPTRGITRL